MGSIAISLKMGSLGPRRPCWMCLSFYWPWRMKNCIKITHKFHIEPMINELLWTWRQIWKQ
jgi:hypothetical protein